MISSTAQRWPQSSATTFLKNKRLENYTILAGVSPYFKVLPLPSKTQTTHTFITGRVEFVEEKFRFYFVPPLFEGFSHGLTSMPCNISEQSGKTDRWKHRGMEGSWFICSWNTAVGLLPSHIDVVATQTETRRTACANINTATRDEGSPSSCKHQGRKRKKILNWGGKCKDYVRHRSSVKQENKKKVPLFLFWIKSQLDNRNLQQI